MSAWITSRIRSQVAVAPAAAASPADSDPGVGHCRRYLPLKHAFDRVAAAFGLVLLSPVLLLIALVIRLTSGGPVVYRQVRTGCGNRCFLLYKFRTMVVDAERDGPRWAERRDPRITRVGGFLRRTHLDELPQLLNVLRGEMSLVGPRPERPVFVEDLCRRIPDYGLRLSLRPGITGLAQVNQPADRSLNDVRTKLAYDLQYLQGCCLAMDLSIMANTVRLLLGNDPAECGPITARSDS